ncbi:OprO/OprP family phosphate-selective porin [Puniceicoccaceae bacterium K14]|nr:OprO/OprP family phosphate-selective porin [Puniceicoccaceae bacterium K14]
MKTIKTIAASAFVAGLVLSSSQSLAADETSSWIDAYKSMGKLYSDKENKIIQEVKVFGRAHYQWNYSDGDSAGSDFSGNGEELRRLRAGASVKFLDGFKALGRLNLEKGGFRDTSIGYHSFDELYVDYGKSGFLGFDKASIGYGRYKVAFGGEEHVSSKRIKTVERSNINNRFGSLRPTGIVLKGEKNEVDFVAGIYSTEADSETWANWDGGVAFQGSTTFAANEGEITLDFIYADDSANEGDVFDFDWAASATHTRQYSEWNVLTSVTIGKDGSNDIFGFVVLPSYMITEKLEAAFRYQYGNASDTTGVPKSSGSRGIRRVARNDGVGTGSGDENHTLYAGLNYYIAGDNLKVMTGVEYESIDGASGSDLDGLTFWTALRTYF